MEDIPQPASEPYEPGDRVRVYISPDDPDSRFHCTVCEVVDEFEDSLGDETGRDLDGYSYRLKSVDKQDVLPVQFRHSDLVPKEP